MTVGIVSAIGRTLPAGNGYGPSYSIPNIIQTDAPINPGNSGGVLVDADGNLIGITTAIESPVRANAGIGFAVPADIVSKVVPELINNGSYEHPWLGVSIGTLTAELATAMNLSESTRGVLVAEVVDNSPAANAGLLGSQQDATVNNVPVKVGGDVVVAIDGNPIVDTEELIAYLSTYTKVGQTITLTILRNGNEMPLDVVLGSRPANATALVPQLQTPPSDTPGENDQPSSSRPRLGILGLDLSANIAQSLNLNTDSGVLVIEVMPNTPAEMAGLKGGVTPVTIDGQEILTGGDIIVALNDNPITGVADLRSLLDGLNNSDSVTLTIIRDGVEQNLSVEFRN
jgi:serine protease Do